MQVRQTFSPLLPPCGIAGKIKYKESFMRIQQRKFRPTVLAFLFFLPVVLLPCLAIATGNHAKPLTIEGKKYLPLRVLSRAFSSIYKESDTKSTKIEANVPAFQAFYVYDKKASTSDLEPLGWYQVGTDNRGAIVGWMNSDDVFEWKQTMCLSYSHPSGRHPVLMFATKKDLEKYTDMPDDQRIEAVKQLYKDIDDGKITPDFPVVTVEPKMAVDITKQFYLLPILSFEDVELDNREARLLKLAAVTKGSGSARESSDIRKNKDYLGNAVMTSNQAARKEARDLTVDVVWVMDTTNSMQPYIDQTLKVISQASERLTSDPKVKDAIYFGVWGYRDSMDIPGIGYDVKNYTPDLQKIDAFSKTLETVKATRVGSQGYAEDMFSGMNSAIKDTAWTPDAMRVIILVGDAPSHELEHKWNISKENAETLRKLAKEQKITIMAIHIKDPRAVNYHETTEEQFKTLSQNPGVQTPSYFSTSSEDLSGFQQLSSDVTGTILTLIEQAQSIGSNGGGNTAVPSPDSQVASTGTTAPVSDMVVTTGETADAQNGQDVNLDLLEDTQPPETADTGQPATKTLSNQTMKAAFVQWIGSKAGAQAPHDIVAWVTDKDLIDTDIQALEVRLLINKRQIDALRETLQTILKAGRTGQISGDDFFSSLQAAAASTARDPKMIKRAKSLAQTGLVPEFLQGLPYTSRIMDMTNELWDSWSVDEQDMFLADLEARIMAYETIHDSPEGWVQLNQGDDPGDYVYPITLDLLP